MFLESFLNGLNYLKLDSFIFNFPSFWKENSFFKIVLH